MEENVSHKLDGLESKIKKLIGEYNSLKTELKLSIIENKELRQVIEKQNEDLKNFQNQYKISKIVSSIADETPNSFELKLKINEYIKEIDKCIAHLGE